MVGIVGHSCCILGNVCTHTASISVSSLDSDGRRFCLLPSIAVAERTFRRNLITSKPQSQWARVGHVPLNASRKFTDGVYFSLSTEQIVQPPRPGSPVRRSAVPDVSRMRSGTNISLSLNPAAQGLSHKLTLDVMSTTTPTIGHRRLALRVRWYLG